MADGEVKSECLAKEEREAKYVFYPWKQKESRMGVCVWMCVWDSVRERERIATLMYL